nr:GNAT family N-acetyltransferase [Hyphomonas sp. Mor2]
MSIRRYRDSDLPILHAANQASVPGVSSETLDDLGRWIDVSTCFVAAGETDEPLGFLTLIEPGTDAYPSANLRWFEDYQSRTGRSVIYVDRIALLPEARGQSLGEALYRAAFKHFEGRDEMGCEVNTAPPNPGSHRFHQRLGFKQVGARSFEHDTKSVAYYVRAL